jgi:site-specific recombinase XerD
MSASRYESALGRLSVWLAAEDLEPAGLTDEALERFVAGRRAAGRKAWTSVRGLRPVVDHLRRVGVIPAATPVADSPVDQVLAAYRQYMRMQRRLAPLTVVSAEGIVRRFLSWRAATGPLDLDRLAPREVNEFVLGEASRLSVGATRAVVGYLRPFLRFLFAAGVTAADLSGAIPGVAGSRLASLPKAVDASTVRALLGSCDRSRPIGMRDFAILTLLARLGLRASEVAAMRLDDIDWRAGELMVRGKGGRIDRLPLPHDVGEALAGYLRHGRPPSASRAVFLRVSAPAGEMSRNAIVFVPRTASPRAGVAVVGAHRLRHTAATEMLRSGASLREVGQVLRHQSDAMTSIYAKVDRAALDLVVRPWPGTEP